MGVAACEAAVYLHAYTALLYSAILALAALLRRCRRLMLVAIAVIVGLQAYSLITSFTAEKAAEASRSTYTLLSREWWRGVVRVTYHVSSAATSDPTTWLTALASLWMPSMLMTAWLIAACPVFIAAQPYDWALIWRGIYAVPLCMLQALGLRLASDRVEGCMLLALMLLQAGYTASYIVGV